MGRPGPLAAWAWHPKAKKEEKPQSDDEQKKSKNEKKKLVKQEKQDAAEPATEGGEKGGKDKQNETNKKGTGKNTGKEGGKGKKGFGKDGGKEGQKGPWKGKQGLGKDKGKGKGQKENDYVGKGKGKNYTSEMLMFWKGAAAAWDQWKGKGWNESNGWDEAGGWDGADGWDWNEYTDWNDWDQSGGWQESENWYEGDWGNTIVPAWKDGIIEDLAEERGGGEDTKENNAENCADAEEVGSWKFVRKVPEREANRALKEADRVERRAQQRNTSDPVDEEEREERRALRRARSASRTPHERRERRESRAGRVHEQWGNRRDRGRFRAVTAAEPVDINVEDQEITDGVPNQTYCRSLMLVMRHYLGEAAGPPIGYEKIRVDPRLKGEESNVYLRAMKISKRASSRSASRRAVSVPPQTYGDSSSEDEPSAPLSPTSRWRRCQNNTPATIAELQAKGLKPPPPPLPLEPGLPAPLPVGLVVSKAAGVETTEKKEKTGHWKRKIGSDQANSDSSNLDDENEPVGSKSIVGNPQTDKAKAMTAPAGMRWKRKGEDIYAQENYEFAQTTQDVRLAPQDVRLARPAFTFRLDAKPFVPISEAAKEENEVAKNGNNSLTTPSGGRWKLRTDQSNSIAVPKNDPESGLCTWEHVAVHGPSPTGDVNDNKIAAKTDFQKPFLPRAYEKFRL